MTRALDVPAAPAANSKSRTNRYPRRRQLGLRSSAEHFKNFGPYNATISINTANTARATAQVSGIASLNGRDRGAPTGAAGDSDLFRDLSLPAGAAGTSKARVI